MGKHVKHRRGGRLVPAVIVLAALVAVGLLLRAHLAPSSADDPGADTPSAQTAKPQKTPKPGKGTPTATPEPTPEPTPAPTPEPTPVPWNLVLVNREHPMPEDWTVDTVDMPNGQKVDRRIYDPLMEMFEAAKEVNQGYLPNVESGWRSEEKQRAIYLSRIEEYKQQGWSEAGAKAEAEKWVALPGTSEHQMGLAVDISGAVYAIYPWLQEHSWEYGFILRYPPDKAAVTGVSGEEWHYRYVGKEAAAEIHDSGLTLEEWLTQKGIY